MIPEFPLEETVDALLDETQLDHFGDEMFSLCEELWPLNRSLTGEGNRRTLEIIKREVPALKIREAASGTKAFDWEIPNEWAIREAWIKSPSGEKLCDFFDNNLNVVGYSAPVNKVISLAELQDHIFSLPEQPDAIPYVTSYYNEYWGFCMTEERRLRLEEGDYEVFIDSELFPGSLSYGELVVPGNNQSEILLSTYICHPSMANNELSGIAVLATLGKWLSGLKGLRHSYRLLFLPETIGPLVYLQENLPELRRNVLAGYVVTCVGDDRAFSFVPSRRGNSISDQVARHVLKNLDSNFREYSWFDRQSDERQYGAPHIDLPVASMMRSKYGSFPEYHTSKDTLGKVVTRTGLAGALQAYQRAVSVLELNLVPTIQTFGEPNLGRRGLYPTVSTKETLQKVKTLRDVISMCDGTLSVLEIADLVGADFSTVFQLIRKLVAEKLIEVSFDGV